MDITESSCQQVIDTFVKNDREGIKMMEELLGSYQKKYEIKDEETINKYFRNDTKLIFQVTQKTMASEDIIKELEEEFDENNEIDMKDKEEYLNFVENINYVLRNIDEVNLKNPDAEFTESCTSAIRYLNQKNGEMNSLNKSMNQLGDTLVNLTHTLDHLVNNVKVE